MSFTILFAVLALFVLIVTFGLAYKIKGLKVALIATAAAFTVVAILFIVMVYTIVSVMPN